MDTILENEISKTRNFVRRLEDVQQNCFDELVLNIRDVNYHIDGMDEEELNDWLYDYVFNCDENISFQSFLKQWERFNNKDA